MKVMADAYQIEVDKVKEMMGEKEKKSIMADIAVRKAVEFVAQNAVVKEKEEKTEE